MTLNLQMRPITHFPSIITNESLWSISVWIFGVGNHIPLGQILVVITNGGGDVYQIISNHGHLQNQPCFAMVHEGVSESRWFPSLIPICLTSWVNAGLLLSLYILNCEVGTREISGQTAGMMVLCHWQSERSEKGPVNTDCCNKILGI